jgi:hypothetical protein
MASYDLIGGIGDGLLGRYLLFESRICLTAAFALSKVEVASWWTCFAACPSNDFFVI